MPRRCHMFLLCTFFALSLAAYGCGDSDDGDEDGNTGEDASGSGGAGGDSGGSGGHGGDGGHAAHDAGADSGHMHDECGLIENCVDTLELQEGLEVEGNDGNFSLHVHMHTDLAPSGNEWMIMIENADGDPVANADITADVYSVDCMHGGPNPPEELTTNDMGMVTIMPETLHGGPWDVIVTVDDGTDTDTIVVPLCIEGGSHGEHDAGMHDDDDAGHTDHSGHT